MTADWSILGIIASTIGFVSFFSACYIVISAIRFQKLISKHSSLKDTLFLVNIVKWLAICDIFHDFIIAWQYLSVASQNTFSILNSNYPHYLCVIKGFIAQFAVVSSVSWNFMLVLVLFRIMYFETGFDLINQSIKYCHMFVWFVSLFASIIPLMANSYGYVNNSDGKNFQCWIKNNALQLCQYGPLIIYLISAICLLFYCIYVRYFSKQKIERLNMRIIYFTCVFVLVWIFPTIDRIYSSILNIKSPIIIVWFHDIGIASAGLCNALVWGTSNLWNKYKYKVNVNIDSSQLTHTSNRMTTYSVNETDIDTDANTTDFNTEEQ